MIEKIKQHFLKQTKLKNASDFLVFTLLVLSLIPPTRMEMMSFVIKGRMFFVQPSINDAHDASILVDSDYKISFKDLNGQKFDFSTLTGKVIFMNLWATWCPPCVAELSAIQELYNLYKDDSNVAFLLVSNESPEEVKKFIHKKGYTFPVYLNENKLPEILSSASIPATFVISKTGKLVISEVGAVNWAGERMIKTMDALVKE